VVWGELPLMEDQHGDFFATVGTAKAENSRRVGGNDIGQPAMPSAPMPIPVAVVGPGTSWASSGKSFWRIGQSHERLPSGVYRCEMTNTGPMLLRVNNETDALIVFPDSASESLLEEIRRFQGMKAQFAAHGFLHKRGVLMWGPPGSGKTTTLQLLIQLMVQEHGGVAILIDQPAVAVQCLQMVRGVEPSRQIIGILEDLDALVERYGESEYLALLDGESQVDNVVYVATTNYPERLDPRFVDRPSRFDTVRFIGMPSAEARAVYFAAKTPSLSIADRAAFVEASDGYSVAHMRELVILTQCFEVSLAEAKERLDRSKALKPSSARRPDRPAFGFAGTAA
jgi:energy-coupling factor transporter ATP-binding protein EcfA2